jgi:transglutaminase-like putative cysteine protease
MATQGAPEGGLMAAAAAVVLLAGGLALARAGPRRPAAGVPVVLLAAVAAVVVAPSLPFAEARPPFDPRALRHLAPVDAGAVNPLARLRAWQAAPDRVLLRVTLSDPVALRLAVLDRYDGVRFSAEPHYTRAGSVLPPPPPGDPGAGAPTRPVTTDIVVAGLDGPWVPVPDRPTRISGPPVAVDPRTGVMVAPGGIQPGQRYRVVAAIPSGRLARLPGATPAPAKDVGAAATTPPGLPSELADLAAAAAGDPSDPALTRLGRLQELFRAGFSEDPSSPPGHSLARLTAFLGPDDRVGSTEQLATAFAVLARSLGYPTRVGVGFRLSGRGEVEVRGADAQAWPEVALSGAGWVAFDPVPPRGASLGNDRRAPVEEAAAAAAAAEVAAPPTPPPDRPPAPPAGSSGHRSWRRPAGAAVGIALAVLALALAVTVGSKRRRRSARRRAPDAAGRVRGAWAEAADRLVERGVGRPRPRTPRDAAQAVGAVSAAAVAPLSDLGELAERAAFAGPGAVAAPDADRAWADLELLESALAAEESRLGSLRHALDPRPLARQP